MVYKLLIFGIDWDRIIERAKRFPWCRPTIDNYNEILFWDFVGRERTGKVRTYIWLRDLDYIVILQKTSDLGEMRFVLITAFWITYENMKEKLIVSGVTA